MQRYLAGTRAPSLAEIERYQAGLDPLGGAVSAGGSAGGSMDGSGSEAVDVQAELLPMGEEGRWSRAAAGFQRLGRRSGLCWRVLGPLRGAGDGAALGAGVQEGAAGAGLMRGGSQWQGRRCAQGH